MANTRNVTVSALVPQTKKPTGLTIARKDNKFTCKWKIADKDYGDGISMQYMLGSGAWVNTPVPTVKTTNRVVTINLSGYHPTASGKYLTKFSFRVRGNRKKYQETVGGVRIDVNPTVSAYNTKSFDILPPYAPALSATLSSEFENRTTFAWTVGALDSSPHWFTQVQWQSILIRDSSETSSAKIAHLFKSTQLGFVSGTGGASGSKYIDENTIEIARGSCSRWFRIRAQGPAGDSEWVYRRHVYATPYQATIDPSRTSVRKTNSDGYVCTVGWTVATNGAHPIDHTRVEYAFAQPEEDLQCPDGATWKEAAVVNDTAGQAAATFSVDTQVATDQCLFVRVNTEHDNHVNYGTAYMVASGALASPTLGEITLTQETMLATVRATNNSNVPDSYLVVRYKSESNAAGVDIGEIPHGSTSVTVQCPIEDMGKEVGFGVYAVVTQTSGEKKAVKMRSPVVERNGNIPLAPANVRVSMTDTVGTVRVEFDWTWQTATSAELSWADHEDAWESTSPPSTYVIDNTHVGRWYISGLETGKVWYIRVRLSTGSEDSKTYGSYSDIVEINLTSAPAIPVLMLSTGVITEHGSVTASWGFVSGDGTGQAYAELAEVTTEGGNTVYTPIDGANTQTAQFYTLDAESLGWASGERHMLAVRVTSASGRRSDGRAGVDPDGNASEGWSDAVAVSIADPISATIANTSLVNTTITEDGVQRTVKALTGLPLNVTVTGAGDSGQTSVIVERAASYHVDRPDETQFRGFEGETIAYMTYMGESAVSIGLDNLVGSLDDGAQYRLIATVQDDLGQTAEAQIDFEVHWAHQAGIPTATAQVLEDELITVITPTAPDGALNTDRCDIYRLSVDRPELIYSGAEFGTAYVDPYPTLGEFGGHRIVCVTAEGDYITADEELAWVDLGREENDILDLGWSIIDFDDGQILIDRNLDVSNSWSKDFTETKYLGGAVQGDWNPAVSRTASVSTVSISIIDQRTIQAMRRLAVYSGVCHIRTPDGSSYSANIEVSDSYSHNTGRMVVGYDLKITRVDPESPDGMTLAEWRQTHPV